MKTLCRQSIGFLLILLLVAGSSPLLAQDQPVRDDADPEFITISGVVKDKNNKKRLEYVNISIPAVLQVLSPTKTGNSLSR